MTYKNYIKLYNHKRYFYTVGCFLYPFFVMLLTTIYAEYVTVSIENLSKSLISNLLIFGTLTASLSIFNSKTLRNILIYLICGIQFISIFMLLYHFMLYGQMIGLPSIYAVVDTTFNETTEFIRSNFFIGYFFVALVIALPMIFFCFYKFDFYIKENFSKWQLTVAPVIFVLLLAVICFLGEYNTYVSKYNPGIYMGKALVNTIIEKKKMRDFHAKMPKFTEKPGASADNGKTETHILIIGESISRSHMSLYGYARKTNPHLSSMSKNLQIVNNACSSRNTTIPALQEMLSFAKREDHSKLFTEPNIIQIMGGNGYKTFWLSNQQEVGLYDSFISTFSSSANTKVFVNHRGWKDGPSFDENLLGNFEKILKNPFKKKFIVIHLIGAHAKYDYRYPKNYSVFGDIVEPMKFLKSTSLDFDSTAKFNQYDNALLYNDYIVSKLIEMQNISTATTVTYISDHGEVVGPDFFGHTEYIKKKSLNEIPLLFWFSESEKIENRYKIRNLEKNIAAPFQSDQTIDSLLDLYNIQYKSVNYKSSLFGSDFNKRTDRYCDTF